MSAIFRLVAVQLSTRLTRLKSFDLWYFKQDSLKTQTKQHNSTNPHGKNTKDNTVVLFFFHPSWWLNVKAVCPVTPEFVTNFLAHLTVWFQWQLLSMVQCYICSCKTEFNFFSWNVLYDWSVVSLIQPSSCSYWDKMNETSDLYYMMNRFHEQCVLLILINICMQTKF